MRISNLSLLLCAIGVAACDAPEIDRGVDHAVAVKGAQFKNADGLTITAQLYDGTKPSTKHRRMTKVTLKRGSQSALFWCDQNGSIDNLAKQTLTVGCSTGAETVSNDDDESLSFNIVMRHGDGAPKYTLEGMSYSGDGTFLDHEVEVLVGEVEDWSEIGWQIDDMKYDLTELKRGTNKYDPFTLLQQTAVTLNDFVGTELYYDDVEANLKVRSLWFSIADDMTLGLDARLSKSGDIGLSMPEHVSLLKTAGKLAEGYATSAKLLDRIKKAFENMEAPVDATEAVMAALSPLGGPVDDLAREIALSDAPTAVREKLKAAGEAIEAREFEGTDYSAGVQGYYAIYASETATEPVAYAVWGTGSGEPDYHDGIVFAFDLVGNQIWEAEEDG